MRLRYKRTGTECGGYRFNPCALAEVDVGDDSASINVLDVFVNGAWKDMQQAFADRDIIPDNYNHWFGEPKNEEDRKRGYFL